MMRLRMGKKIDCDMSLLKKQTFGVIGMHHGAGSTMIALNFAYFMSKYAAGKTAFVEVAPGTDMEKFEEELLKLRYLSNTQKGEYFNREDLHCVHGKFKIENLTIFKSVTVMDIPMILNEEECNFVFDFGMGQVANLNEFLRTNTKIIVCNLTPWKRTYVESFMNEARNWNGYKDWNYIANFSVGDAHKYYILDDTIKLKKMPLLEETFVLSDEVKRLYRSFL